MSFNLVLNEFMMGAGFFLWGQHLGVKVTSYLQSLNHSALQCGFINIASMCLMLWT